MRYLNFSEVAPKVSFGSSIRLRFLAAVIVTIAQMGCSSTTWRADFFPMNQRASLGKNDAPYLKTHVNDRGVYVLDEWRFDEGRRVLEGRGIEYTGDRQVRKKGRFNIAYDRIVMLETNRPETVAHTGAIVAMSIVAAISLTVTTICMADGFDSCTIWGGE